MFMTDTNERGDRGREGGREREIQSERIQQGNLSRSQIGCLDTLLRSMLTRSSKNIRVHTHE